jgi:hypothetical protein
LLPLFISSARSISSASALTLTKELILVVDKLMAGERWKQYFEFKEVDNNRTNGHCKLCEHDYKDKTGIFSNFLKHMKRKHSREYDQVVSKQSELPTENIVHDNDGQQSCDATSFKSKQSRINASIAKHLIIKCNLPLSLVENNAFREFLKECSIKWDPTSARALKQGPLRSLKEKVLNSIHATLDSVNHLTLTVDGWSDRRCRSFLGITTHFINSAMEPQSYLLDFVRLKSPHTGENIHHITESILDQFNIKDKVYRVVTDNASSMIKAYRFGLATLDDSDEEEMIPPTTASPTSLDDDGKRLILQPT